MRNDLSLGEFFAERRKRFGPIRDGAKVAAIEALVSKMAQDPAWLRREHIAYALATVHHETDREYLPIEEYASGQAYEDREDLGNTKPGDGQAYKGRGFVQLTGRRNYAAASAIVGEDLELHPKLMLQWEPSYLVMAAGMNGRGLTFTGKKLSDYDRIWGFDWKNARRIINGLDCWERISRDAQDYDACLLIGGL